LGGKKRNEIGKGYEQQRYLYHKTKNKAQKIPRKKQLASALTRVFATKKKPGYQLGWLQRNAHIPMQKS